MSGHSLYSVEQLRAMSDETLSGLIGHGRRLDRAKLDQLIREARRRGFGQQPRAHIDGSGAAS